MSKSGNGNKGADNAALSGGTIEKLRTQLDSRVDGYEIFFSSDDGMSVEARGGAIDALKVRSSSGVGLRTIVKKRQGFGFTSVLDNASLEKLVDNTLGGSKVAASDEFLVYAKPAKGAQIKDLGIFDENLLKISEDARISAALEIEKAAMAFDSRVKRVRKASFGVTVKSTRVVNSNGIDCSYAATFCSGSVMAVAEEAGESQMGYEMDFAHGFSGIDPTRIGAGAAKNAVRMLGAKKIDTIRCPAVLENSIVGELLESLAGSFLADNVAKGKSMLANKKGVKVASGALTIYDDGVLLGGWASSEFDGEGVRRQTSTLLDAGVCNGYLYDTYWAAKAGVASTGSAVRGGFKGLPSVGLTNLYVKKGGKSLDELMAEMNNGLFITEVLGAHTINSVSGDFSIGASGFKVEAGRLAYPVRGIAISGNLLDLFDKAAECGSDLRFFGSIGAPSILISELEASGS